MFNEKIKNMYKNIYNMPIENIFNYFMQTIQTKEQILHRKHFFKDLLYKKAIKFLNRMWFRCLEFSLYYKYYIIILQFTEESTVISDTLSELHQGNFFVKKFSQIINFCLILKCHVFFV